jgi:bifunctional non-homologous end joining protein LigD
VCNERGMTDFDRLRTALAGRGGSRAVFLYGFDLLAHEGEDLRRHRWEIRRTILTGLLRKAGPGIRLSEHLDGEGETIYRHVCALGAEGIVAKRRDRPYRSGRCADWVKVRNPNAPARARVIER